MSTQEVAKAIRLAILSKQKSRLKSQRNEKLQGAALGAGITLFLTLLVTSSQFLFLSFPAELISALDQVQHLELDIQTESNLESNFAADLDRIASRQGKRELQLLRIRSFKDAQAAQLLDGKLATLEQILIDKGTMEAYASEDALTRPPALAMVQSLDRESEIWNFMLDSNASEPAADFSRKTIGVVESTNRDETSAELWRDDFVSKLQMKVLDLRAPLEHLEFLCFKALVALAFIVASTLLFLRYGKEITEFFTSSD